MIIRAFLCVLFLGLSNAYAADLAQKSAHNSELIVMQDKLHLLEKNLADLQNITTDAMKEKDEGLQKNRINATTIAQLEEIREQIRSLRGDIEQLQFDYARLDEKLVKMSADFEHRISEISRKMSPNKNSQILGDIDEKLDNDLITHKNDMRSHNAAVKKEDNENTVAEKSFKTREQRMQESYDQAYELLKEKKVDAALEKFSFFVEEFPDTDLTGNAYYWRGELFFQQDLFDKSAIEYLRGYQASIRGSRAADNLLKLGISLAKMEKRKEACTTFMKLEKEFPKAANTIKKKNASEMKRLRCKTE